MKIRVAATVAALLIALNGWTEIIDRVMAVVGSQVVTLSDVRAADAFGLVPPVARAPEVGDTLAGLVNRQLMLSEVERYSAPDPEPAAVERRLAEVRARFSAEPDYAAALARTAMSAERLRGLVSDNLRIEAYVDQRFAAPAQPTPDEVLRYYREHPAEFTRSGALAPFEEVQQQVLQKASSERRAALIADWLDRLRRRGQVEVPGPSAITGIR